MRLYLDTNCIIYAVEGINPFHDSVLTRVREADQSSDGVVLTSVLSRTETLVKPLKDQDTLLLAAFERFFGAATLTLIDVTKVIADNAAALRARYRFRTPDAIHLATAMASHADIFLTGDTELARCTEVNVELIHE